MNRSETAELIEAAGGKAIATGPQVKRWNGQALSTWQLEDVYGYTDEAGPPPGLGACARDKLGMERAIKKEIEPMNKLRYTITIDAPREKVWKTMLEDATYREWTRAFNEGGSYFEGSWEKGSEMRFLGPDPETGKVGGMFARIHDSRPYEFVSIEHLGIIFDGKVDTTSDEVKAWAPAYENYTLTEKDGGTEVLVEMEAAGEHVALFDEIWPSALAKVKELAER